MTGNFHLLCPSLFTRMHQRSPEVAAASRAQLIALFTLLRYIYNIGRATGTDVTAPNHFSCLPLHPAPAHLPLFLPLSSSQDQAPQTNSQDDGW